MFKKNIEVLKSKNPRLAKELESIDISSIKDVEVYRADSEDLILKYRDVNLHNSVDPIREAKSVWLRAIREDLRSTDIQVVLGLGLGYLFKRAYISSDSRIAIYEPFTNVLRFVLEYVDLSAELSEDRIYLTNDRQELLDYISQKYLTGDKLKLLYLNSYAHLEQQSLIDLSKSIFEVCEQRNADRNTNLLKSKKWTTNSILNVSKFDESIALNVLKDSFKGKPAIILSAGPSLANDVEVIKENRKKYVVIAAAKALTYLLDNSIKPDFTVFTDEEYFEAIIEGKAEEIKDLNFVLDFRSDTKAFNSKLKNKFIYFSATNNIATAILQAVNAPEITVLPPAGSSSLTCFYVAKELGCSKIVFEGLDLAFIDKKSYVGNLALAKNQMSFVKVKSVTGEMIDTRSDYALFIRQFEDAFNADSQIDVINTSLRGAFIEGVKYLDLKEVCSSLKDENINADEIISKIVNSKKESWKEFSAGAKKYLQEKASLVEDYRETVAPLIEIWNELDEAINAENPDIEFIQQKYDSIQEDMSVIRNTIIKDEMIMYYMQKELFDYTEKYSTKVIQNAESVRNNLKLEQELVINVFSALNNLADSLKK